MATISNFRDEGVQPPAHSTLNSCDPDKKEASKIQEKRRSSSEPSDFFEFFNDFSSEMSNAEDIIFCGKLMPYKNPPRIHPQILKSLSADDATRLSRTYCHSLPELCRACPNTATMRRRLPQNSRSMDWRKPTVKPEVSDIHRSSSKSSVKSEGSKVWRPRWFLMMFGPLKLQPEMQLSDMKNRQIRRNPGKLFPVGEAPAARSDRRNFWGLDLLKVLSCKNHASVAVKASIGLVPHLN